MNKFSLIKTSNNREIAGETPNRKRISNTEQEFIRPKPQKTKAILMEKEVRSFIDSVVAENTRKTYIRGLELLEEYMGKTISEIIDERREDFKSDDVTHRRRLDRKVEQFYVWLINDRGMQPNTAWAYVTGVKSIMSYYDISLKLKIKKPRGKANDFVPSIGQLREMYEVGDLTEKILLSMAIHIPMRINDFNEIKKSHVKHLMDSDEFPVWFEFETRKTKTVMPCFITEETMQMLKKYIKTLRPNNEYLFQGRGKQKLNEDSINRTLKKLVKETDIDTRGKRVRFHMFRKVFISVARNMIGLSDDQIKMLSGKRIKEDMDPYYVNMQLEPWFIEIANQLRLTPTKNNGRVGNLEDIVEKVGIALAKSLTKMVKQQLRKDGVIGLATQEELDPMKDWLKIIQNYIVFDEVIPPTPERKQRKKAEGRGEVKHGMS